MAKRITQIEAEGFRRELYYHQIAASALASGEAPAWERTIEHESGATERIRAYRIARADGGVVVIDGTDDDGKATHATVRGALAWTDAVRDGGAVTLADYSRRACAANLYTAINDAGREASR